MRNRSRHCSRTPTPACTNRSAGARDAPAHVTSADPEGSRDSASPALRELRARLAEIGALTTARDVLSWDQSTYMPEAGARDRGFHMSVLNKLSHEMFVADRTGELLAMADEETAHLPSDHRDAQVLAVVGRDYRRLSKVPAAFLQQLSLHSSDAFHAWREARPADDFGKVAHHLERAVDLSREYSAFFPGAGHPADPQIDFVDDGFTVATLRPLFTRLRTELVALLEALGDLPRLGERAGRGSSPFEQYFAPDEQLGAGLAIAQRFGYDVRRGRVDITRHPFATSFGVDDVRITTRYDETDLTESLFSTLHETGHALYELGIDPRLSRTPLARGASSGVHESQSRLWENLVGRSRPFWRWAGPFLAQRFPEQLKGATPETLYRNANRVERSLIRTEADELTYNLHVIVRFELELELLEGTLAVRDLPDSWRDRYQQYLGIAPTDDRDGVLQDVHWYAGLLGGSFQGYTIGNVLSVQFFEAAERALGPQADNLASGEFAPLREWLGREV
ncbi:MAG TPA: carboxypeptidase M32, partial [Trueperaceae bacterium]|nr:carboxypeptidase M32 [Trueperaceae bacterium]